LICLERLVLGVRIVLSDYDGHLFIDDVCHEFRANRGLSGQPLTHLLRCFSYFDFEVGALGEDSCNDDLHMFSDLINGD
jgi:hypothetical protein